MADLKSRVEGISSRIAVDMGRRGFDESALVIYGDNGNRTVTTDSVVVGFYADLLEIVKDQQFLIEELQEREAKLVESIACIDIWIKEMREAVDSNRPEWFFLDARMMNLEAWLRGLQKALKELEIKI